MVCTRQLSPSAAPLRAWHFTAGSVGLVKLRNRPSVLAHAHVSRYKGARRVFLEAAPTVQCSLMLHVFLMPKPDLI